MAIFDEKLTDSYALYNGDCIEVLPTIPSNSVHLSVYSPPFMGLYNYSSSDNDLSNCKSYDEFMEQYAFVIKEIERVTLPGRLTAVHCADVPAKNDSITDFPGDIIRLHEDLGFIYHDRITIWKEPLRVAIRTRAKGLMHKQIVKDSTLTRSALADYIVYFRKRGENPIPVTHPHGITEEYFGSEPIPEELLTKYKDWKDPKTNKLAHIKWQRYASSHWHDIRPNRVLEYKKARDKDDEKHVHPLQLDAIERIVILKTNPYETVLTPFMGVGSEVYGAVKNSRKGIGIELKPSYFRQAVKNLPMADRLASGSIDQEVLEFTASENDNFENEEELVEMDS